MVNASVGESDLSVKCEQATENLTAGNFLFRIHFDHFFIQLPESLTRPEEHAIKMNAGQTQIGADALFLFFRDIKTKESLAVTVRGQFIDHPPDEGGFLFPQQLVELARRRVRQRRGLFDLVQTLLPRLTPKIINHEIASNAAHKA